MNKYQANGIVGRNDINRVGLITVLLALSICLCHSPQYVSVRQNQHSSRRGYLQDDLQSMCLLSINASISEGFNVCSLSLSFSFFQNYGVLVEDETDDMYGAALRWVTERCLV